MPDTLTCLSARTSTCSALGLGLQVHGNARWGAAGGVGVAPGQAARGREAAPVGGGLGAVAALPGNAGLAASKPALQLELGQLQLVAAQAGPRRRPPCRSTPSMSERTASSSRPPAPDQRGRCACLTTWRWHPACRTRSRVPGRPHAHVGRQARTPLQPAVRLQARGRRFRPHCRRVLAVASISPARALAHCRRAFRGVCVQLHAQLCLPHTSRGAPAGGSGGCWRDGGHCCPAQPPGQC